MESSAKAAVLDVQKYEGLVLEPPTRDVVEHDPEGATQQGVEKHEEWIKKKKTELTTTRQIETRVKRQVILEDGKVVDDSGPIVSTNTTEDTEKQESQTTERRDKGEDEPGALEAVDAGKRTVSLLGHAAPADGVVREVKEKKIVSREEKEELLETEDVKHLGDFSDEVYVKAANSGVDNIKDVLYSPESQQQLVPIGCRVVHQSAKSHKVVDTEDTDLQCRAQPDGTLVTEKKRTTEHEEIFDEDVPAEEDDRLSTGSHEKVTTKESSQRVYKSRDEQAIEDIVDGKVVAREMKYVAENQDIERDGPEENPSDWDSLSDRIRKARRRGKTLLQQHRDALLDGERKDALTKRPLDFDQEEETRKLETSKWLESHFGSDSSRDSRNGDADIENVEVEPTKKTFFNVTIKSTPNSTPLSHASPQSPVQKTFQSPPREKIRAPSPPEPKKYFQGISNWAERKDTAPARVFSGHAFREELKGTVERNRRLRQPVNGSVERLNGESLYAQSKKISSYRSGEQDDDIVYVVSPKNTYHYRRQSPDRPVEYVYRENGGFHREIRPMPNGVTYLREEEEIAEPEEPHPVAPQRKRALERKMKMMYQSNDAEEDHEKMRSASPSVIRSRYGKPSPPRAPSPAHKNKVSTAIGNSLRKLVGKIAERKAKLKTKRSMSPPQQPPQHRGGHANGEYQQYDQYIDSHIETPHTTVQRSAVGDPRRDRAVERRSSGDIVDQPTIMVSPKQRFYLGEDPYGSSIYGRENKYDGVQRPVQRRSSYRVHPEEEIYRNGRIYSPYQTHASTLGRFSASTNQLRTPTYATSSQTLPRKLEHRPAHSSTINVSIVNTVAPPQNTGPAKPARSYKALNRSKSLNVHAISETNGTPYKSNPQLNLKSPSIVSMISRSQRDLRPIGTPTREVDTQKSLFLRGLQEQAPELYRTLHGEDELSPVRSNYSRFSVDRAVAHRNGDMRTRSPVTINKDTASIIRRGSSSTDDYAETYNYTTRNDDPRRPSVTNTTQNFSKKTIPGKGVIETSKTKSVTTSRYVPDLHNSHLLNRHVIEVRGNSPRH
ncbi:uncharacterized protein LOC132263537 isoform X2 [Phlebotomus argentipes]|uniref:uncharacterized protein LOC132263537 isoform X2 n=1 Tax=Phlebotomus argentipes TaxID=94469 RepID=UPI002892E3D6|nr:uncharacterized protein LOC132263537 isoform X2 [Phlebotomus argentipes]XP_059619323.1 uncharacterized protein LOC132263537 isoform X2 [Phlebotomus argentipes]XP_059619325.1 uncharacterized protein LOC132263537 isoform X2 [Phlebotomus argentipes]XP_059619326.1 uncharacterized protein LOC132263537 isoform X2 [Phlebotomus argentipes]